MLTLEKTRKTDYWQSYKIVLFDAVLVFSCRIDDESKPGRILDALNAHNVNARVDIPHKLKMELIHAGVEFHHRL